jgi:bacillolysin
MSTHRRLSQAVSVIVILTLLFSSIPLPSASAQDKNDIHRQVNAQTGKVSFISPENGRALPASKALGLSTRPQDPAMALAKRFGPEFGLNNPEHELKEVRKRQAEDGRLITRYQQAYQGIPVMGGELIVNTNDNGDLYSMSGEVSSDLSLSTRPTIDSEQARQTALQVVAKWYQKPSDQFAASEPEL